MQTNKSNFWRNCRLVLVTTAVILTILATTALFINRATPSNVNETVRGVAIGHWEQPDGVAYLSGRRLNCTPLTNDTYQTRCTVEIAGAQLEILASRNAPDALNQFGGTCTAVYQNETLGCEYGSRHVHIHQFVYIDQPATLNGNAMAQLRQQNFFENRPEGFFFQLAVVGGILLGGLMLWNGVVWLRPFIPNKIALAAVSLLTSAVAFLSGFIFLVFWTSAFWD